LAAAAVAFGVIAALEVRLWPWCLGGFLLVAAASALSAERAKRRRVATNAAQNGGAAGEGAMRAFCEALDHPVLIIDARSILRHANRQAQETFGTLVVGEPVSWRIRNPEFARLLDRAIAEGRVERGELEERVPTQRWLRFTIAPATSADRKAGDAGARFLVSFLDLTENRLAERQRTDFIANASHELRTPLASLRGFIETIRGPAAKDPKAIDRFLGVMLEQAERMSRLVDDLLSLSRIEMKSHLRPEQQVDLVDVLASVADAMAPVAKNFAVRIETDLPRAPAFVHGDRDELHQVFQNLVENACKYGQAGKRVVLSLAMAEPQGSGANAGHYEASVQDFGPGIAAEHLPRLTERFYRVDVALSREKQGTGLGLAIVKHILTRHGARLVIASEPGKGARFSVRFTAANSEKAGEQSRIA
jgi:two-component system phosphate regulon sensor histidine kinase PhoR